MKLVALEYKPYLVLGLLSLPVLLVLGYTFRQTNALSAIILILILGVLPIVAILLVMRRRSLTVENDELIVRSSFYTMRLPLKNVESIATGESCPTRLGLRTNGVGLPGFHSGWFRVEGVNSFVDCRSLPNVCIRSRSPTAPVLLEVEDPDELVRFLRCAD